MQNMHSCGPEFPLNPSNGHREWEESPGTKPWESHREFWARPKNLPDLRLRSRRSWKGYTEPEMFCFVGWGW